MQQGQWQKMAGGYQKTYADDDVKYMSTTKNKGGGSARRHERQVHPPGDYILKKNLARSRMLSLGRQFAEDELVTVQLFSALKKTGISELQQKLDQWLLEDQCKE